MIDLFQDKSEDDGSTHIIGINKGGGTKTTTTVNLGTMLKLAGCRVLVVDCAPESHTTYTFGYLPHQVHHPLYDLLTGTCTLQEAIVSTYYNPLKRVFFHPEDRVDPDIPDSPLVLQEIGDQVIVGPDLIPLKLDAMADEKIRGRKARDFLLAMALQAARKIYDYILFDTNPDLLNILTTNALFAADWACIPFVPDQLTAFGFVNMRNAIVEAQQLGNTRLQIAGVLMAKVTDLTVHRDLLRQFREILAQQGIHAFAAEITDRPHKFLNASNRRSVIVLDDPLGVPAFEYWSFLSEYITVVGGPGQAKVAHLLQSLQDAKQKKDEARQQEKRQRQRK